MCYHPRVPHFVLDLVYCVCICIAIKLIFTSRCDISMFWFSYFYLFVCLDMLIFEHYCVVIFFNIIERNNIVVGICASLLYYNTTNICSSIRSLDQSAVVL